MNEITVASLACPSDGGIDQVLVTAADMIDQASSNPSDLVCLPELVAWAGLDARQKVEAAEPLDGKFAGAMSKLARKHSVNILAPLLEKDADRIYNSMVWFDRQGKLTGVYRKVFLPDYELDQGICPGPLDFDVFQTEFGPIGCCICFDLNFKQVIDRLAAQQAKLVLFPAMFQGLSLMQAWAKLYRMYFVSAAAYPYSAVVNPLGIELILPWKHDRIMTITLNLDYLVLHSDHTRDKLPEIAKAYGQAVRIDYIYIESCMLLTSRHPEKSAADIAAEFGLETEEQYLNRCSELRKKKLP